MNNFRNTTGQYIDAYIESVPIGGQFHVGDIIDYIIDKRKKWTGTSREISQYLRINPQVEVMRESTRMRGTLPWRRIK